MKTKCYPKLCQDKPNEKEMLFPKLYNALEQNATIFDDCEGNGLRYNIKTKTGFMNIQVEMEYVWEMIELDIFAVKGELLLNEEDPRYQEFDGRFVSELDIQDQGSLGSVTLFSNGRIIDTAKDGDMVKTVLEWIEYRLDVYHW